MYRNNKNKINKKRIIILFMLMFYMCFELLTINISFGESMDKKAIVLILDELSLNDLFKYKTENIKMLQEKGAIGLMNTRSKSSLDNKSGTYLSLGMGVRTDASINGGMAYNRDTILPMKLDNEKNYDLNAIDIFKTLENIDNIDGEILNLYISETRRIVNDKTPNNNIGLLGNIAKDNNLKIGVLGNSDNARTSREFTLMAIDENGIIPYGKVDGITKIDSDILGNISLDEELVLNEFDNLIDKTDILFIDYGDSARIQRHFSKVSEEVKEYQKSKVLKNADAFIGKLLKKVDLENTLFIITSPNAPAENIKRGNHSLTPLIVYDGKKDTGILSSDTTKREGIVTNFDFGATILNYFNAEGIEEFSGYPVKILKNNDPVKYLLETEEHSIYLRNTRKIFHWIYIILILIVILGYFVPVILKKKPILKKTLSSLTLTVFCIPILMLLFPILNRNNLFIDIIIVYIGAFVLGNILNIIIKDNKKTISLIGIITTIMILVDVFVLKNLMINSPLGSDAIAGGRFYGLGNDYMGIMLGSIVLSIFILFQYTNMNKLIKSAIITLVIGIIIIALSPLFGTNVGGMLSALAILGISLLTIWDKKLKLKGFITIVLIGVVFIISIALLDSILSENPTHAGKAINALLTGGGFSKLFEIIYTKLKQVFWNLLYSSWNILLFLQIILTFIMIKFKNELLKNISSKYEYIFKAFIVIIIGSIVIFSFNDTGTIAASLILSYMSLTLGMLLNEKSI